MPQGPLFCGTLLVGQKVRTLVRVVGSLIYLEANDRTQGIVRAQPKDDILHAFVRVGGVLFQPPKLTVIIVLGIERRVEYLQGGTIEGGVGKQERLASPRRVGYDVFTFCGGYKPGVGHVEPRNRDVVEILDSSTISIRRRIPVGLVDCTRSSFVVVLHLIDHVIERLKYCEP